MLTRLLFRLLLDPGAGESGSGGGGTIQADPNTEVVTVKAADLAALTSRLAALEKGDRDRAEAERGRIEEEQRKTGKWEDLLKARDTVIGEKDAEIRRAASEKETLQRTSANFAVTSELNGVLAQRTDLAEGAAAKLARLVRDELVARPEGENWRVVSRDNKTVSEFVKGYLADPANALFLKANSKGGAGGNGDRANPTITETPAAPRNLGEAVIQALKETLAQDTNKMARPRFFVPTAKS